MDTTIEKQKELAAFFDNANTKELQNMLKNPMELIRTIGFDVNEEFAKAIENNLQHVAYEKICEIDAQAKPLMGRGAGNDGVSFSAQPWGLVLEIDHETTQKVISGVSIASSIASAISAVASSFAAPAAVVAGVFSAFLAVSASVIAAIDQGNGIYLTLTWPQIALIAIFPPIPVPTTR